MVVCVAGSRKSWPFPNCQRCRAKSRAGADREGDGSSCSKMAPIFNTAARKPSTARSDYHITHHQKWTRSTLPPYLPVSTSMHKTLPNRACIQWYAVEVPLPDFQRQQAFCYSHQTIEIAASVILPCGQTRKLTC